MPGKRDTLTLCEVGESERDSARKSKSKYSERIPKERASELWEKKSFVLIGKARVFWFYTRHPECVWVLLVVGFPMFCRSTKCFNVNNNNNNNNIHVHKNRTLLRGNKITINSH